MSLTAPLIICETCEKDYHDDFPRCPHCYCKKDYLSNTFFELLPNELLVEIGKRVPLFYHNVYSIEFVAKEGKNPVFTIQFDNVEDAFEFIRHARYGLHIPLLATEYRVTPFVSEKVVARSVPHAIELIKLYKTQQTDSDTQKGLEQILFWVQRSINSQNLKKIKTED